MGAALQALQPADQSKRSDRQFYTAVRCVEVHGTPIDSATTAEVARGLHTAAAISPAVLLPLLPLSPAADHPSFSLRAWEALPSPSACQSPCGEHEQGADVSNASDYTPELSVSPADPPHGEVRALRDATRSLKPRIAGQSVGGALVTQCRHMSSNLWGRLHKGVLGGGKDDAESPSHTAMRDAARLHAVSEGLVQVNPESLFRVTHAHELAFAGV